MANKYHYSTTKTKLGVDVVSSIDLANVLEVVMGATYPTITLDRRLGLLTNGEYKKVSKKLFLIECLADEIEDMIAHRAEVEKDPWP